MKVLFFFIKIEDEKKFNNYIFDNFVYYESKLFKFIKKKIKEKFAESKFFERKQKFDFIQVKEHVKLNL